MLGKEQNTPPANPYDFQGWMDCISKIDISQSANISKQEYDTNVKIFHDFLTTFPCLYNYWVKYASLIWAGSDSYEEVQKIFNMALETNLRHSVEMWSEIIKFYQSHYTQSEMPQLRFVYGEALDAVGHNFKSGILWRQAIDFEVSLNKSPYFLLAKAITNPIINLRNFWEELQNLLPRIPLHELTQFDPNKSVSELLKIDIFMTGDSSDDQTIRSNITQDLTALYNKSLDSYSNRVYYENSITRTYFHFLSPDEAQISNWESYINEFETLFYKDMNEDRLNDVIELYERALIPCNYIESIWIEYANFIESVTIIDGVSLSRDIYKRIPYHIIPHAKILYAEFEEEYNNENAEALYTEMSESDYAEQVITSACYYKRTNRIDVSLTVLRNSRDKMLQNNDIEGAAVIATALLELYGEESDIIYSTTYLLKFIKKLIDENKFDDANQLLFSVTQGENAEKILIEDRLPLIQIYIECCRMWGVDANFQLNLEMTYNKLKNKMMWHKEYFKQTELNKRKPPEKRLENWIDYQKNLNKMIS
ncbi:TPR-like protein [Histomonas meleagridis]|uniref:TPR-like protein n=1 Tax=Histomonas meleagridis TaxID=135588 RepID=UPI00355989D4|nr:TPR-like protein [Histomonas meleagridis]KAH0806171.1 TPR-like protein [Histomonas meleagridis]